MDNDEFCYSIRCIPSIAHGIPYAHARVIPGFPGGVLGVTVIQLYDMLKE